MLRRIVTASAALALTAGLAAAAPSSAAPGEDTGNNTIVTFSLSAGSLSLTAPAAGDATGSGSVAPLSQIAVGVTGSTVVDNTGALEGWQVTATSTDLVNQADNTVTIPKSQMRWVTDPTSLLPLEDLLGNPLGVVGSGIVVPGAGVFGATPVVVAQAFGGFGGGSYEYDADVTLTVPLNAEAGTYQATITQTLT